MKKILTCLALGMLFGWLAPATLIAAERPSPRYQLLANELAIAFLQSPAPGEAELAAFLEHQAATAPALQAAVAQAVAVGRALIADGVPAQSRHFARLLADSTLAAGTTRPAAVAAERGVAAAPAPSAAQTSAEAKSALWRAGIERLKKFTPAEQKRYAAFNGVEADELAKAFRRTGPSAPLVDADRFLLSVGYAERANLARTTGAALPEPQVSAAQEGMAALQTPPALTTDAWLRNNGFSFATGFGIAQRDGTDHPMGAAFVRWNMWQRVATAKWNQRIGESNPEGYAQVPFWGAVEYYDRDGDKCLKKRFQSTRAPLQRLPVLPELTFIGPFLGRALLGEKLLTKGTEERPYLVGMSLGFGFYREGAPFLTFDFGKTVSPKHGLRGSANYLGVSFDALVFESVTGFMRRPAATPATPGG